MKEIIPRKDKVLEHHELNIELPDKQESCTNHYIASSSNSLHGDLSQIIQNFNEMSTKELDESKPVIPLNGQIINKTVLSENNFEMVVNGILDIIPKSTLENRKQRILNHLNNYNTDLREMHNWLLNNQKFSNSIYLLGLFNHFGIGTNVDEQKAFQIVERWLFTQFSGGRHAQRVQKISQIEREEKLSAAK